MNDITCSVAEDLMPLYMDGCCSEDSRQALEKHMGVCKECRDKYNRMRNDLSLLTSENNSKISDGVVLAYSQKVRKHKLIVRILSVILSLAAIVVIFLLFKTVYVLNQQGGIVSIDTAEGTINLTEGDFTCNAKDLSNYVFFTNTGRIIVRTDDYVGEEAAVEFYNTDDLNENIMIGRIDAENKICIFSHLSSQYTYAIAVDSVNNLGLTVSCRLTFWEALSLVLQNK